MEVYTTGGGYFVQDILQFLALYHASNDFDVLMAIGIMAGVLCLATTIMLGTSIRVVLRTFAVMALVGSVFIGRSVSVDIHDKTYGTLSYYSTVDNVPFGVALLAHYTTGTSYYVTERLEQLIATPNDLAYQSNGMLFGATIVAQQARWRAVDNVVHERVVEFYQQCIVRGINLRYFDIDVIVGATDLVAATDSVVPASLSYYDVGSGSVQACQAGWNLLKTDVNAQITPVLQRHAASLFQRNPGPDGTATTAKLSNALTAMQTKIGMSSATATNTVRQAMLINAFDDSIKRYAAISGNDASLSNLTNSIADIQRRSAYANIGLAAQKWVPYLKIVFEVIYYGVFPFAVLMMLTPLAWTVFKGYCGGFIWLASWEPMSAILHGIVLEASSGFYREAAVQTSDGQPTDIAMTWANHFGLIATEQEIGATAGYLMMSVPFLSLAILFGARQMTSLATSMLNVGQGTAMEASRAAATGQIALSTVGMNTMNANQWLTSTNVDTGRLNGYFSSGGGFTQNRDLSTNYSGGSALPSNVGLSLSADQGIRRDVSEKASAARSAAKSATSETASYLNEGASRFSGLLEQANQTNSSSTSRSNGWSLDQTNSLRNARNVLNQAAESAGVDSQVFMKTALAASAGLKKGPAGASVGGDTGINSSSRETSNTTWQAATSKDVQDAIAEINRIGETTNWGNSGSFGTSASEGQRWSLDQGKRHSENLANTLRIADEYTRADSQLNTKGVVTGTQLTVMAKNALEDQFPNNPAAVERVLNARDFSALASQSELLDGIVDDLVDFYGAAPGVVDNTQGFDPQNTGITTSTLPPGTVAPLKSQTETETLANDAAFVTNQTGTQANLTQGTDQALSAHGNVTERVSEGASQTVGGEITERAKDIALDTVDAIYKSGEANVDYNSSSQNAAREVWQGGQSFWGSSGASNAAPIAVQTAPSAGNTPTAAPAFTGSPGSSSGSQAPTVARLTPRAPSTVNRPQPRRRGPVTGSVDAAGFYQAPNITYDLEGKTRSLPVNANIMQNVSSIANNISDDIGVVVTSGGQHSHAEGGLRTGSTRHDHGNAVDFYLTRNGEKVLPAQDPALYEDFIRQGAEVFPGIGHYDWGLHMGGGNPAFWGPDTTSSSADPRFAAAYQKGRTG